MMNLYATPPAFMYRLSLTFYLCVAHLWLHKVIICGPVKCCRVSSFLFILAIRLVYKTSFMARVFQTLSQINHSPTFAGSYMYLALWQVWMVHVLAGRISYGLRSQFPSTY